MRKFTVCGREAASVTVVSGSSPAEKFAAAELSSYLCRIFGDAFTAGGPQISIELDTAIARDGFKIAASNDGIAITGGNSRGVVYGAYAFLERYAGARFFMPGLESLGSGDVTVDEGFAFTPPFEYRRSDWCCGEDVGWSVKNAVNSRAISENMGGYHKYGGFVHTMHDLTDAPWDQQPCLSDPENLKKAIARVHQILKDDPEVTIVSVSQNDNCNYCKCDKCAAVDAEEGSHMGTLLRFVNAVADSIKDEYPHVAIDTLAYQYTRNVPKLTKPRDNVIIRLCSIECCFSHPLADPTCAVNAAFARDITDWNKICGRIYIWDYVTDFSYYIPTFPNFSVIRDNMRFFAEHGVRGMYPEGNYNSPLSGEFGEVRAYLLAKLMYDPQMSAVEYYRHMDEFLAAYYGEGWRYIRAYIDFTCAQAAGKHMSIWINPLALISRETYLAMESTVENWWNAAEAMAGDRIDYVKRSRLQWRYIKLMLHPNEADGRRLFNDVERQGIKWNEWRRFTSEPDFSLPPDKWESK